MPQEVTAYRADDGTLHEDKCAAATRNVELLVKRSPLAENQPFARDLVAWLIANPKEIRDMLEAHETACPKVAEESTASEQPEGTRRKGPRR
jgi:hypothetical protein